MFALAALGITTLNAGVHVGISIGIPLPAPVIVAPAPVVVAPAPVVVPPPMPAPVVEVVPAFPTPGYFWVGGSWGCCNNHWVWTHGHWCPQAHWGHGYRAGYYGGFHGGHGHR